MKGTIVAFATSSFYTKYGNWLQRQQYTEYFPDPWENCMQGREIIGHTHGKTNLRNPEGKT